MIVEGYTLQLYCDRENKDHDWDEFPHEYTGEKGSTCRRHAREDGWILHRNREATCPKCSGKEPNVKSDKAEIEGMPKEMVITKTKNVAELKDMYEQEKDLFRKENENE